MESEHKKMITNIAHTLSSPLEPKTFDNVNDYWKSLRNYIVHEDKDKLAKWLELNMLKTYIALSHDLGHYILRDKSVTGDAINGKEPKES